MSYETREEKDGTETLEDLPAAWRVTVTFGSKPSADVSEDFHTRNAALAFARKYDGDEYRDAAVAVFDPAGTRVA